MNKRQKKAVAIGAGVATLAAAAAGTYLLTGKRGEKNRAKVKAWVSKAGRDVDKQMAKMEKVTKATYDKTVDGVLKQYKGLKNIDQSELLAAARELKGQWDSFATQVKKAVTTQPVKKVVPKKKTTKSTKK